MSTLHDIIKVSTDLPGGNACVLNIRSDINIPEVHFTPSPAGGPEAMWFFFRIEVRHKPVPEKIRCVLHFVDCLLGGRQKDFYPVFETEQGEWRRVSQIEIEELADGQPVVSWTVPGNEGAVNVALSYPYGMRELGRLLGSISPPFGIDNIGVTLQNNLIQRLSNKNGSRDSALHGIYCLARQHSGETPGSWVLDGFLRGMASADKDAPLVWAVPFVNLDGILSGHYGKDSFPYDFNRAWGSGILPEEIRSEISSQPMRYEVGCIQNDMIRWSSRCKPSLVIDFHAPGISEINGIYCFLRDIGDDGLPDVNHRPWIDAFQSALGSTKLIADRFFRSDRYVSRWNTARVGDFVIRGLKVPGITFEVPYTRAGQFIFTREDYQRAGEKIAEAVIKKIKSEKT
jgi:hypothetical protein